MLKIHLMLLKSQWKHKCLGCNCIFIVYWLTPGLWKQIFQAQITISFSRELGGWTYAYSSLQRSLLSSLRYLTTHEQYTQPLATCRVKYRDLEGVGVKGREINNPTMGVISNLLKLKEVISTCTIYSAKWCQANSKLQGFPKPPQRPCL